MKKVCSVSLSEKLVDILDQHCLRFRLNRSEVIEKLLIDQFNQGIDPDEVNEDEIIKRKLTFLNLIYNSYHEIPEFKNFTSKFDLKVKLFEKDQLILLESSNKKFYCKIKILPDTLKISARYKTSSSKNYKIYEKAYEKHKKELEEQGFKKEIYQRSWDIEYRYPIREFPEKNEINIIADFIIQKLLVLYTNLFIDIEFIINKETAEALNEKTAPLMHYKNPLKGENLQYLYVLVGSKVGEKYPIQRNTSTKIGRHNCEINLLEQEVQAKTPVVSSQHAELFWKEGILFIVDLGSTNGTTLNGKVISENSRKRGIEYELKNGDHILIANIELKLVL